MAFYQQGGTGVPNSGGTFTGPVTFSSTVTSSGGLNVTGALNSNAVVWEPVDNALLAATSPVDTAISSTVALTAGTVYVSKIQVRTAFTFTTVNYNVSTAGTGGSTGSFVGVYNSAGTLLSSCADIGANLLAGGSYATALTTPQALAAGTFVWAAFLCNLATTQPTMRCVNTTFAMVNIDLTSANSRSATGPTGQTTLPASFTPSTLAQTGAAIWMGAS